MGTERGNMTVLYGRCLEHLEGRQGNRALAANDDLNSVSRTHMVEEKN